MGTNLTTPHSIILKKQIPDHINFEPYIPEPLRTRTSSQQPSQASSRAPSQASHPIKSVSQIFASHFPREPNTKQPRTPHQENVTIQTETPRQSQRTHTTKAPTKPAKTHFTSISSISRHSAAYRQVQRSKPIAERILRHQTPSRSPSPGRKSLEPSKRDNAANTDSMADNDNDAKMAKPYNSTETRTNSGASGTRYDYTSSYIHTT